MKHQLSSDGSSSVVAGPGARPVREEEEETDLGVLALTPPRTDEGISSILDDCKPSGDRRWEAAWDRPPPEAATPSLANSNDMPDLVTMLAMSQAVLDAGSSATSRPDQSRSVNNNSSNSAGGGKKTTRQTSPLIPIVEPIPSGSPPRHNNLVWMMETGTGETLPLNPPPRPPFPIYGSPSNLLYAAGPPGPGHVYEAAGGIPPHFHHLLAASSLVWSNAAHLSLPPHHHHGQMAAPLSDLGLLNEAALVAGSAGAETSGNPGDGSYFVGGAAGFPLLMSGQAGISPFLVPPPGFPHHLHHAFPLIPSSAMAMGGPGVGYGGKRCANCGATSTPSWRRCPAGKDLLCNACGLYQKLHNKSRPFRVAEDGSIKVQRSSSAICKDRKPLGRPDQASGMPVASSPSLPASASSTTTTTNSTLSASVLAADLACCGEEKACSTCGTRDTPLWRRVGSQVCCNACALFFKAHGHHRSLASETESSLH